jgi:hypothetical protein
LLTPTSQWPNVLFCRCIRSVTSPSSS